MLELAGQRAVDAAEQLARSFAPLELGRERHLHHRGHQRRRHAVTRDVGDNHHQPSTRQRRHVVEIARHRAHRQIRAVHAKAGDAGQLGREQRLLDRTGQLQLPGERREVVGLLARPRQHEPAERRRDCQHHHRLAVESLTEYAPLLHRLEDGHAGKQRAGHNDRPSFDRPASRSCVGHHLRHQKQHAGQQDQRVHPHARVRAAHQVVDGGCRGIDARHLPGAADQAVPAGPDQCPDEQARGNQDGVGDQRVDVVKDRHRPRQHRVDQV